MIKAGYILFTLLYPLGARILALLGNKKAQLWVEGRKDVFSYLHEKFDANSSPVVWFHCASLGEFEQGRPVMEALRKQHPHHKLIVTFFSPSGYEIRKNYAGAEAICYLPMDNANNARHFIKIVKPSLVIFIKYEFWYHYLTQVKDQNVPLLLVSALFRSSQPFFKTYGGFHRKMLQCFTHIFVQDEASLELLQSIRYSKAGVSGDTRFDRVLDTANQFETLPLIERFCDDKKVLVAGSTWTEDDEELDHFVNQHLNMRFIIAPHDVSEERLKECEILYKHTIRYSQLEDTELTSNTNTLIIDNIGMLSRIYQYAHIAYVGGAFGGDGIHNILEAAVFAKPVVFGPEHDNFPETSDLIMAGGAFSVKNALELEKTLTDLIDNESLYANAGNASGSFVKNNAGATEKVINFIQEKRLLTN